MPLWVITVQTNLKTSGSTQNLAFWTSIFSWDNLTIIIFIIMASYNYDAYLKRFGFNYLSCNRKRELKMELIKSWEKAAQQPTQQPLSNLNLQSARGCHPGTGRDTGSRGPTLRSSKADGWRKDITFICMLYLTETLWPPQLEQYYKLFFYTNLRSHLGFL